MQPEIHGFTHIDYGKVYKDEIARQLAHCIKFHEDNFCLRPTKFYTPWGASTDGIQAACNVLDLEMVDCSSVRKLGGRYGAWQLLNEGRDLNREWDDKDILIHWWENSTRLEEVLARL